MGCMIRLSYLMEVVKCNINKEWAETAVGVSRRWRRLQMTAYYLSSFIEPTLWSQGPSFLHAVRRVRRRATPVMDNL